jgi:hypothetical protein
VRQPNWDLAKVFMFIEAKRGEILVGMDYINLSNQFETIVIKWWKVANNVNAIRHSFFWCNNATCKDRWCSVYGRYNKIFDYMSRTRHATEYWDLMAQEKIVFNLLRHFNCQVYEMVDMFMGTSPTLNPPHVHV